MKKLVMMALAMMVVCSAAFAQAVDQKEIRKERQEIRKLLKERYLHLVDRP